MTAIQNRRERLRAEAEAEIRQAARRLLLAEGPTAVTLSAIAREMGMTAPGLYRYYGSLGAVLDALRADLYGELTHHLEEARDVLSPEDALARLMAVSRAFRLWSVSHPAEFGLTFGAPPPGLSLRSSLGKGASALEAAGGRFGAVFESLFAQLWREHGFPIRPDNDIRPALRSQLHEYACALGGTLPLGAIEVFLSCWITLYGTVAMEVFGHLGFALTDAEAMFESQLEMLAGRLQLRVPG